jgi:hypothetical protein
MERQMFTPEPSVGYRWVPGLRTRVEHEGGGYLVRTNEAGFRSEREFTPAKAEGTSRILLFGDSFSAGDGVSNPRRYSDQLEQLLPDVEVFNLALSGSGTDQQLLLFREFAPKLEHDLVVVGVMVENIRRIVARYRIARAPDGVERAYPKPYFTLDGDELVVHGVPVSPEPRELESFDDAERAHLDFGGDYAGLRQAISRLGSSVKELALRVSRYQPLPAYSSPDNPGWRLMRRILETLATESHVPVVIMPIPLYHYIEDIAEPTYVERFEELQGHPNITLHNPLPHLRARPQAERRQLRFRTDEHPTALAHRLLAESLATAISPLL